jgi:hypothetical protein
VIHRGSGESIHLAYLTDGEFTELSTYVRSLGLSIEEVLVPEKPKPSVLRDECFTCPHATEHGCCHEREPEADILCT